jgi:hypothetical protein
MVIWEQNGITEGSNGLLLHDNRVFLPVFVLYNVKNSHCRRSGEVCSGWGRSVGAWEWCFEIAELFEN